MSSYETEILKQAQRENNQVKEYMLAGKDRLIQELLTRYKELDNSSEKQADYRMFLMQAELSIRINTEYIFFELFKYLSEHSESKRDFENKLIEFFNCDSRLNVMAASAFMALNSEFKQGHKEDLFAEDLQCTNNSVSYKETNVSKQRKELEKFITGVSYVQEVLSWVLPELKDAILYDSFQPRSGKAKKSFMYEESSEEDYTENSEE